jgi:hypothetical protein
MKIWFDMDNTLNLLYDVPNWLNMLQSSDPTPYAIAKPRINLSRLARYLNRVQAMGHEIGIISWLSKNSNPDYDKLVTETKIKWLNQHLPSVKWDEIHIVAYGRNKWEIAKDGILFDDDMRNHKAWKNGNSYFPTDIFNVLQKMAA